MRYSQLFGKTVREISGQIQVASHKWLVQGGFIRESVAGRYFYLPLGMRVKQKVMQVIREEMEVVPTAVFPGSGVVCQAEEAVRPIKIRNGGGFDISRHLQVEDLE